MLFDHVLPAYLMDMMMWVSGKRPMYVPVLLYFLNTDFLTTCPVNEHSCILRQDKKSTTMCYHLHEHVIKLHLREIFAC